LRKYLMFRKKLRKLIFHWIKSSSLYSSFFFYFSLFTYLLNIKK
jgi:hypothetical protein